MNISNQARQIITAEAVEVLTAINGKNEFYSVEEATARFHAVTNMTTKLNLLTEEEVEDIKKDLKVDYHE